MDQFGVAEAHLADALLSQLIADVTGQPGVLPLVSHALLETWRRRGGTALTLNGYLAAGGIAYAIAVSISGFRVGPPTSRSPVT